MTTTTRVRPRSLPSTTTKLKTEMGNLYVTVSVDEEGEPFEVFGTLGKAGSLTTGVTELACRLISLHLRRGTPLGRVRRVTRHRIPDSVGRNSEKVLGQPTYLEAKA